MGSTKQRLIDAGLRLFLEHGYNDVGIQALLDATATPKGSFYHHFKDKEDFGLQVIDTYIAEVHKALEACLGDQSLPPLARVRRFFELTQQKYKSEGYMGCLMGALGQELSGVNEAFRNRIEGCFSAMANRLAACLDEARQRGELRTERDLRPLAEILIDCWEGAALRSRLRRNPASLNAMLDFYINSVAAA